ncbi:hypothetical protein J8273_5184 [Carpediemonas membranifera]|uniref:Nuclear pore complex protein Nup85 n=1 Tax=Carpediemonas membranifera TaxID=201153 RepID=A0A8J6B8H2_9EUKA|nr:hypothetical protein J8273_5184 [Carpediemonas membranifera]|eukprot:KAG9392202.1 hypothetical protein J8273_5184 [Carpediemonas membranifera]
MAMEQAFASLQEAFKNTDVALGWALLESLYVSADETSFAYTLLGWFDALFKKLHPSETINSVWAGHIYQALEDDPDLTKSDVLDLLNLKVPSDACSSKAQHNILGFALSGDITAALTAIGNTCTRHSLAVQAHLADRLFQAGQDVPRQRLMTEYAHQLSNEGKWYLAALYYLRAPSLVDLERHILHTVSTLSSDAQCRTAYALAESAADQLPSLTAMVADAMAEKNRAAGHVGRAVWWALRGDVNSTLTANSIMSDAFESILSHDSRLDSTLCALQADSDLCPWVRLLVSTRRLALALEDSDQARVALALSQLISCGPPIQETFASILTSFGPQLAEMYPLLPVPLIMDIMVLLKTAESHWRSTVPEGTLDEVHEQLCRGLSAAAVSAATDK